MGSFKPLVTGNSRVFIIEGRARPDHQPIYQANMKAGSPSQSFGDVEDIEVPSPDEYGHFDKVGEIRDQIGRVEIDLVGRYAREVKSTLLRLARKGCSVDVQINMGACTDPTNYNLFTKKVIIENAFITDWEAEELGALGSDELAKIDETATLSGRAVYETTPTSYSSVAGDIVTNEIIAGVLCDKPSCGDCQVESDGCSRWFGVTAAAGGSPGTPPDVVFIHKGVWYAHDIDSMSATEDPNDVGCLGQYLCVVSQETESLHYALLSEFDGVQDPGFTEVTDGFVSGGGPRAISTTNSKAFIVGANGYIYDTTDVSAGVTVRNAGALTTSNFNDVDAFTDDFAVAVGDSGVIAFTANGETWGLASTTPVGVCVNLNAVQVKDEDQWLIGASNGYFYYTLDGGETWTRGSFPGAGSGSVEDIYIANDSIVYMAHTTTTPRGRILKSTNGGYDWVVEPPSSATLPLNDRVNTVAACGFNPDIVYGAGLADNGTDGFVVYGTD